MVIDEDDGMMRLDREDVEREMIKRGKDIKTKEFETIEKEGVSKDIIGENYDEISKSIGAFNKNSFISEPENKKLLQKNHNLRSVYLLLVGSREPMMVGDFKNKISLTKPALYSLFHKLREMGLVKNISVMNLFIVDSPITEKNDLFKDDLKEFNSDERKIVLKKFRKWTAGLTSNKQKQNYIAGTFYWDINKKGKDEEFLKWVAIVENSYRKKEQGDGENEE